MNPGPNFSNFLLGDPVLSCSDASTFYYSQLLQTFGFTGRPLATSVALSRFAVDPTGKVGVCWYDRRNDQENFQIERFCAVSPNAGSVWQEHRVDRTKFAPLHGTDDLINPNYMGDYDGLASDFTGSNAGFIGAFQVLTSGLNPDVRSHRFGSGGSAQ